VGGGPAYEPEAVGGIDRDLTLPDSGLANDTAVFDISFAEIIAEIRDV
jgi:hypothetical protein